MKTLNCVRATATAIVAILLVTAALICVRVYADTAASPTPSAKLTGKVIGTPGSYNNTGADISKVFDGDINTFFDAPESTNGNGDWVGLDLGTPKTITKIRFAPRAEFPDRMIGGKFQGSTTADFAKPVDLYVITDSPKVNQYTEVTTLLSKGPFQYVRYLSPDGGWGNVAEIEFY